MFHRYPNEDILKAEGHNVEKEKSDTEKANEENYKPKLIHRINEQANENTKRPVVDVSSPLNWMDETHSAYKLGTFKSIFWSTSVSHYLGVFEQIPYSETYDTMKSIGLWMFIMNVLEFNLIIVRRQNAFQFTANPRTRFAWSLVLVMSMLRMNIATLIGAGGHFLSYEYLYTYAPRPIGIKDPTPNGWKMAWRDGQDCYCARAIASIFPALGYAFYNHSWYRFGFAYMATASLGLWYELNRRYLLPTTHMYKYMATREIEKEAAYGSLSPNLAHRSDPETNLSELTAEHKYFLLPNANLNTFLENIPQDIWLMKEEMLIVPNPYFNWVKSKRGWRDEEWKVKNDMWKLPSVLNPLYREGAFDQVKPVKETRPVTEFEDAFTRLSKFYSTNAPSLIPPSMHRLFSHQNESPSTPLELSMCEATNEEANVDVNERITHKSWWHRLGSLIKSSPPTPERNEISVINNKHINVNISVSSSNSIGNSSNNKSSGKLNELNIYVTIRKNKKSKEQFTSRRQTCMEMQL